MRLLILLIPLLPFIIYFLYYMQKGRKLSKGEILVGLKEGPWVKTLFVSLVLLIVLILTLTFTGMEKKGEKYTPARFENGKLIPDSFE